MDRLKTLFGEPAVTIGVALAVVAFLLTFSPWDADTQGIIMTALIALGAVWGSWATQTTFLAAVLGALKALATLFVTFGLDWSDTSQAAAIAAITAIVGMFFRTQTTPAGVQREHVYSGQAPPV